MTRSRRWWSEYTDCFGYLDMVRAGFKFDKYVDLKLVDWFQDQSFIQIDFPVLDQQDDSKMIRTASFMQPGVQVFPCCRPTSPTTPYLAKCGRIRPPC